MARVTYDFSLLSTGSGVPTGWTQLSSATNVAYEIVTDGTSPGGQALEIQKTGSGLNRLKLDSADGDNQAGMISFESDNASAIPMLWINGGGGDGTESGYALEFTYATNTVAMWRYNGDGTRTSKGSTSFTLTAGSVYWTSFARFSDSSLVCKVFADGSDDPTTFTLDLSDATYTTGSVCVSESANITGTTTIHWYSAGTDYDQPCAIHDTDFPSQGLYIVCTTDDSLRVVDSGANYAHVIAYNNTGGNLSNCSVDATNQYVVVSADAQGVWRFDRYGLNKTVLDTLVNIYGVAVDEANGRVYYSQRLNGTQNLKYVDIEGGTPVSVTTTVGFFTAGGLWFNPDDGFIYWAIHTQPKSYNSAGTLQHTYPAFSDALNVMTDDSLLYVGTWNANALSSVEIGGSSYTSRDVTSSVWQMAHNADKTQMWAGGFDTNNIITWSAIPPSAGTRSTFYSLAGVEGVAYFNFPSGVSAGTPGAGGSMGMTMGM